MKDSKNECLKLIAILNKIGIALSAERDNARLLELILSGAMKVTNADAGTIYLLYKNTKLSFAFIANKKLNIKPSRMLETGLPITSIPLYIKNKPNLKNIVSYCFHQNKTVNIANAYHKKSFDFSGTEKIDNKLKYYSKSFLTIPLRDHKNKTIGILQLINAKDDKTGKIIAFPKERCIAAESLASQAAITLTKQELIQSQKKLFQSFLQLIAKAIDEKSIHTSNHCSRVPLITIMLAKAVNNTKTGPLKDNQFTKDELDELMIAAWLHDCGKLATPDYIINKSTKLETLIDCIEVIDGRFEILKRDAEIAYLKNLCKRGSSNKKKFENAYKEKIKLLNEAQKFIQKINLGAEFLSIEDKKKIYEISSIYFYVEGNKKKSLLSKADIENLTISKGTLNDHEIKIIKNHVQVTYSMLKTLPYPEHLKNVPEIAGSHHERIDGKGYPHGLTKDNMSIQARILAIADIFEALTSVDRPYKKTKSLTEVLHIMHDMKKNGHIDPDLYDLFINEKIYLKFAKQFLNPKQIDV